MQRFRVPRGIAPDGRCVPRADAVKGTIYTCPNPECGERLDVRQGTRQKHFSHRAKSNCSLETVTHILAKLLIVQAIEDWKRGVADAPTLVRKCLSCGVEIEQKLPDKSVDFARKERPVGGRVLDVAFFLMNDDQPRAGIEILVSHAVDDKKSEELELLSIPWIELSGAAVVDAPTRWLPVRDRFRPLMCKPCKVEESGRLARIAAYERQEKEKAERLALALAAVRFDAAAFPDFHPTGVVRCSKCLIDVPTYKFGRDCYWGFLPEKYPRHTSLGIGRSRDWVAYGKKNRLKSSDFPVVWSYCHKCNKRV